MGPREREVAQQRGQRKLDAMRRRAIRLRERVVVIAIVGFVLLWTVVFVQMATGNDPALGTGPVAKKHAAIERKRKAALEADDDSSVEGERVEAERIETERRESEARELEELESVSTGQS